MRPPASSMPTEIVHDNIKYLRRTHRHNVVIYFHEELSRTFHRKFNHTKKKTKQFPFSQNLVEFLRINPKIIIHFTELENHRPFKAIENNYFVNIDSYIDFCKRISSSTEGRAQAFFGQHINYEDIISKDLRQKVLHSASEEELLDVFNAMDGDSQTQLLKSLNSNQPVNYSDEPVNTFSIRVKSSIKSSSKRNVITAEYPKVQLETLKEHRNFLLQNLDKNETFIQNWIDAKIDNLGNALTLSLEEEQRLKKSRCLVFGLEFVNHKREGAASQKRFDILTKLSDGRSEYVLIELKSPSGKVFEVKKESNKNGGISTTYLLSDDIARALPQIATYKGLLRDATNIEWQKIGYPPGEVVKSIILVGTRPKDDLVWDDNYRNLRSGLSSSIEIMTYTDLLEKLNTTIKNLEENL